MRLAVLTIKLMYLYNLRIGVYFMEVNKFQY